MAIKHIFSYIFIIVKYQDVFIIIIIIIIIIITVNPITHSYHVIRVIKYTCKCTFLNKKCDDAMIFYMLIWCKYVLFKTLFYIYFTFLFLIWQIHK